MDFNKAVDIIRKDLEETSALLEQLAAVPGTNEAEIELARSRVHSATEMVKLLPRLNVAPSVTQAEEVTAMKVEKLTVEKKTETTAGVETKKITEEVREQTVSSQKTQDTGKAILADRFGNAVSTIGEKASSVKQDEVITSVMHNKPVKDITSAIGINDRFYFIRELFSGDSIAYQETIRRLNDAVSLGEAMKILDESTVMGSDPLAQSSFVEVVRRKFSINV
jgi:hypothetical protein